MPRNPAGIYTLPNLDVVSNTTILSSDENVTRHDLENELTESLDRNGRGPMKAPVRTPDQTAGSPAFSFVNETNSGWYRAAAGDIRLAVNGVDVLIVTATGLAFGPGVPIPAEVIDFNALINGDFTIYQRGVTSVAAAATGTFVADRWYWSKVGSLAFTIAQSTDVPTLAQAGRLVRFSLHADCTTAQAVLSAGDNASFIQGIEGYNWLPLAQKQTTLSFWVKATKTGTYCVALRNSGLDRSCVMEYTVNAADTWERKVVTFPASPSAGTWNYTNGAGVFLNFVMAVGTTFITGTPGVWVAGNVIGTSNQVNVADNVVNNFRVAMVKFQPGAEDTPFKERLFSEELLACQRYWEKSYNYAVVPGTAATYQGSATGGTANGAVGAAVAQAVYKAQKRIAPTVTFYNPQTGTVGQMADGTALAIVSSMATQGENGFTATNGALATANNQIYQQWTSSAEF